MYGSWKLPRRDSFRLALEGKQYLFRVRQFSNTPKTQQVQFKPIVIHPPGESLWTFGAERSRQNLQYAIKHLNSMECHTNTTCSIALPQHAAAHSRSMLWRTSELTMLKA